MSRRILPIGFVLLVLISAGCATRRVVIDDKPLNETRLFVTRAGEKVTLAWDSDPDFSYTVLFNHTRSAKSPWKVLPGFDVIRGTGRRLTYTDTVPSNTERYYRLQAFPAVSLSP